MTLFAGKVHDEQNVWYTPDIGYMKPVRKK